MDADIPDGGGSADAVGERMRRTRTRIDSLAVPAGGFVVACRESGVRPEPVTDTRFESYTDAERACGAARRYREALGELDPHLERYDLVVSERSTAEVELASVREVTDRCRPNGLPRARQTVTVAGQGNDEWLRLENAPVVHFAGPDSLLDDEIVTQQLDSKVGTPKRQR